MVASVLTDSSVTWAPLMSWMERNPLYWKDSTLILTISFHHWCKKTKKNHTSITVTSVWSCKTSKQEEQQRDLQRSQLVTDNLLSSILFTGDENMLFAFRKHRPCFVYCCSSPGMVANLSYEKLRLSLWIRGFPRRGLLTGLCRVKCLCPQCSPLVGQCRIAVDNFVFRSVWPPQGLTNHFLPESPWLTHFLIAKEVPLLQF